MPLHNIELRRQTRHQTFFYLLSLLLFIFINLNCASGAAPKQKVAALDGAPGFYFTTINIYFNLFELCIRCRLHNKESRYQIGHQTFLFFIHYDNYH